VGSVSNAFTQANEFSVAPRAGPDFSKQGYFGAGLFARCRFRAASRAASAAGRRDRRCIVGPPSHGHLAQAGAKVTLFEKSGPARGHGEFIRLGVNAFETDPHYRSLRLQSLLAYHDLDQPLGLGMTWGDMPIGRAMRPARDVVHSNAAQLADTPYPVRSLEPADLAALSPALQPGPATAAFFSAIDGHLNPVHVTGDFSTTQVSRVRR